MTKCICCHGTALQPVITCRDVPVVANALAGDGAAARAAPTGDVELVVCETCGLVFNQAFDPAKMDYAPEYENALHHSPSFQSFADGLVADLVARHGLKEVEVAELQPLGEAGVVGEGLFVGDAERVVRVRLEDAGAKGAHCVAPLVLWGERD